MSKFIYTLEGKFISIAVVIVLIVAFSTGFYFYQYEYGEHLKNAEERAEILLRSIAVSFTNTLLYEELGLMEEGGLLENQIQDFINNKETGLVDMAVYGPEGILLAANDYSWFRDTTHMSIVPPTGLAGEFNSRLIAGSQRDLFYIQSPLNIHGKKFGTLIGFYSLQDFDLSMQDLKQKITIMAILGLIISVGLAYLIAKLLAHPIKRLSIEMMNISDPYYFPRGQIRRRDEIGTLEKMYISMLMRLRDAAVTRQEAQQAMIQSERLATLGTLAANLAHDVSNPLAGARSCLRRIAAHPEAVNQTQKYVGLMDKALERIEAMVQDLLQYSRKKSINYTALNLTQIIQQSVELFEYSLEKKKIKLRLEFSDSPNTIAGDARKLEQVLINLLSNASDAMPDGGIITIRTISRSDCHEILVQDNGKGISSAELERIFEPFYTTKAEGKGTGLGLSICKSIIEDHRGSIALESEEGVGTKATLTFPILKTGAGTAERMGAAVLAGGKSSRMGRDKGLIALQGVTMIEKIISILKPVVTVPVIITNTPKNYAFLGLPIFEDIHPGLGPLSGIHSALKNCEQQQILILACDLPFVTTTIVKRLCDISLLHDIVVLDAGFGVEPLCAIYSKACIPVIEQQISAGQYKVTEFFKKMDVKVLYLEQFERSGENKFLNVNTPEDLQQAELLISQKEDSHENTNR